MTTERISNYSLIHGVFHYTTDVVRHEKSQSERSMESTHNSSIDAWRQFIAAGDYACLWTLSFLRPYSDSEALNALWHAFRFANRDLFGPRWHKQRKGLYATVVAERHKLSLDVRGRLHFHILIHQDGLRVSVDSFADTATRAGMWLRDTQDRPMSSHERIDVRAVYDTDRLANYLSKDFSTSMLDTGNALFFVDPSGINGNVLPLMTGKQLANLH